MSRVKIGDRVRVRNTGETGQVISTALYNAMSRGSLKPSKWRGTRWVRFDKYSDKRPIVVGHSECELEVI